MFSWAAIFAVIKSFGGLLAGGVTSGIGLIFGQDKVSRILLIIALGSAGVLGFMLYKNSIENKAEIAALQKFNKDQQDRIIKDKDNEIAELKRLNDLNLDTIREANKTNLELTVKYDQIKERLRSSKGNTPSSEILKKTIDELRKNK